MRSLFLLIIPVFCLSCMTVATKPGELADRQPTVLAFSPSPEVPLPLHPEIRLLLSEEMDEATINAETIWMVEGPLESSLSKDLSRLYHSWEQGELAGIPIRFQLEGGGRVVLLTPETNLEPGSAYTLVVTTRLLSKERLPLSQNSAEGAVPLLQTFYTEEKIEIAEELLPGESSETLPEGVVPTPVVTPTVAPAAAPKIVLNEIYYDAETSDTDGLLFVELFGTAGAGLSGYQISFVNGSDGKETEQITLPAGASVGEDGFYLIADVRTGSPTETQVLGADLVDNFDPQNGPDAVQLLDPDGNLVDAVGYGEGIVLVGENGLSLFEVVSALDVSSGHSLERISPGQDTNNNAADFVERQSPTPGQ